MNVALVGNPNCGKTTLFNRLTGNNGHVGNWPGVTVEKKVGKAEKYDVFLTDLPGIYSLSPYSMEERIARNFLLEHPPDGIIHLMDATTMERSLYLAVQVIELGIPTVLAINMADLLSFRGDRIDTQGISDFLGVPVIPVSAKKKENLDLLMETVLHAQTPGQKIPYDSVTQASLNQIKKHLADLPFPDFYAAKLLESDPECLHSFSKQEVRQFEQISKQYEKDSRLHDRELSLAESRYRIAGQLVNRFLHRNPQPPADHSKVIDAVVLHPGIALPLFGTLLFLIFYATFSRFAATLQNGMAYLLNQWLAPCLWSGFTLLGIPEGLRQLITDGVFPGVSSVLSFLPQILILFFFLSLLEDSGYMARAAFLMDGLLQKIGLSGKAFIPMLMGFGCTTPAVMAARTLEKEEDRRITILLTPFLSCSAKLPIYTLFIGTFFEKQQGLVLFCLYLLGLMTAILCGWLLKRTILKGDKAPFVMELPAYRTPSLGNIVRLLWDKIKGFLKKAGTVIVVMNILIWGMENVTMSLQVAATPEESILGSIGRYLTPLFVPLGFGQKEAVIALLCGLMAKESVVSSLAVLYGGNPVHGISGNFTPASACSFMVFCLLYVPCISALATMKKELNSRRWAAFSFCLQMMVAWLFSFLTYRLSCIFF